VCILRCLARLDDWVEVSTLVTVSRDEVTYIGEPFAASHVLALMGFLAGVSADVDCESTPLNEALAAACSGALVRSFIGVYPVMSLQIRLAVEALQSSQSTPAMAALLGSWHCAARTAPSSDQPQVSVRS
jgi:hypothetical protein